MIGFIVRLAINAFSILIVTYIVKGVEVTNPVTAIVAAFVLGVINAFVRPLIVLLTLPINVVTLGVFTLFINGFLFYAVSKIVKGFVVTGFWPAFFGSILFGIISFFLSLLVARDGFIRIDYFDERRP